VANARNVRRTNEGCVFSSHLGSYPSFFNLILQSVIPLTREALPKPAQHPRLLRVPPPAWPFHGSWSRYPNIRAPRLATAYCRQLNHVDQVRYMVQRRSLLTPNSGLGQRSPVMDMKCLCHWPRRPTLGIEPRICSPRMLSRARPTTQWNGPARPAQVFPTQITGAILPLARPTWAWVANLGPLGETSLECGRAGSVTSVGEQTTSAPPIVGPAFSPKRYLPSFVGPNET
jgi:hypothetical protein